MQFKNKLTGELVEAMQFIDLEEGATSAELLHEWVVNKGRNLDRVKGHEKLLLHTLGGWMTVLKNDYLIWDADEKDFFIYGSTIFESLYDSAEPVEESNLVAHARRELNAIGEDPDVIEGYLKVIQAFADMGHSGGSASVAIPVLNELFQFHNLSPLTDDPEEWFYHDHEVYGVENDVWQNKRCGEAFSNDGGKTYYLLSEGGNDKMRKPLHNSVSK